MPPYFRGPDRLGFTDCLGRCDGRRVGRAARWRPCPASSTRDGPGPGCVRRWRTAHGGHAEDDDAGNTFIAPAGWSVVGARCRDDPRGARGRLAHRARRRARRRTPTRRSPPRWAAYNRDAKWPLKVANDAPDKDGWSKQRRLRLPDVAERAARRRRRRAARQRRVDRRASTTWRRRSARSAARRSALIFDRLLPKGYARESFAGKKAHPLDAARIAELGEFVEAAQKATGVPGVSLGIVQDGKVVFAGGFGVRELGKPAKVDGDTLYMIASNTKALTTLLLAKLVDEGKITWDTPVTHAAAAVQARRRRHHQPGARQAPDLRVHRPAAPGLRVAVRVQGRHAGRRAGDARHDAADQQVRRDVPVLEPARRRRRLRRRPRAVSRQLELGAAYDKAMQTQVFDPLGMTSTTFDYARALAGNHAARARARRRRQAGARGDGDRTTRSSRCGRPAPRWSNVNDMLKYVQMELAKGTLPDGKPLHREGAAARAPRAAGPDRQGRHLRHGADRSTPRTASRSSITAAT